jgi:hypothetical protein
MVVCGYDAESTSDWEAKGDGAFDEGTLEE